MKTRQKARCGSPLSKVGRGFFASSSPRCEHTLELPFRVEGEAKKPLIWPCLGIIALEKNDLSASCKAVAVLYARKNSVYKQIAACDVFDLARDARSFTGRLPVIAHPPCRLWGRLRQFSTACESERELAFHAVAMVRRNGGVLEHPAWSTLWSAAGLPLPGVRDEFGGFTYPILQSWWGHKAPKATWLYIVGLEPADLPAVPFELGIPAGRVSKTGSMKLREGTPFDLAQWLFDVAFAVALKSPVLVTTGHLGQFDLVV